MLRNGRSNGRSLQGACEGARRDQVSTPTFSPHGKTSNAGALTMFKQNWMSC